jgi:hypothetical protein
MAGPRPDGTGLARRGVRLLLGRGLLTAGDVHRYGLVAGRGVAVKDVAPPPEPGQGDPAREVALYRAAALLPEVAGIVPRLLAHDEAEHLLVLEGVLAARRLDRVPRPLDSALAASFGASLGAWHRASARLAGTLPAVRPWLLDLGMDGASRPAVFDASERLAALADAIVADDEHRAALAAAREAWTADVVMHGDVRFSNVLVRSPGPAALVDWEYAGTGDARWDVAGAVQDYLSAGVEPGSAPVRAFLDGYAGARGEASDESSLRAFVAGRLLLRAFQLVGWTAEPDEEIERHRELARAAWRGEAAR